MIPIRNIYYMLSYAFQVLTEQGYRDLATEEFQNTGDLFAAILARGITYQLKRGLGKEYIPQSETMSTLRGKIDIAESIKTQSFLKQQMVCEYDEFSENSTMNRIIKSSVELLLRSGIPKARKKELRKLMVYFGNVETIDLYTVNWDIRYNRNNQTYRMMIAICRLLVKGLLQSQSDGQTKVMDFMDEQRMNRLYEKFILEYYRKHHPELHANPSRVDWQLDDDYSELLPVMQTDITLTKGGTVLIIDAKYYSSTTQQRFGVNSLISGNLYQIFTYVKNKDEELTRAGIEHSVSGMLLYARTDELVLPNNEYRMSGNRISVKTLDLDQEFSVIAGQLDQIAAEYFQA